MTNIKITELGDIGNNVAPNSLVPIVDMAGTPLTKKANLQNVGNLILNGAGLSNFVPAARAILAQSVTNAAQPNITSTGTLTSLTVSGNVNLGTVENVSIAGGNSGQILSTDGNGVLSWVNDANSSYGDSNVVSLIAAFGSNTISTTGLITGDGGGLSNVPYTNVTGTPTLGNVSAINLDGNVSNVLRGDGTFAADAVNSYGDSNVATYLPTYGGNVLVDSVVGNTTDNLGYMRWVGNSSGDGNGYTTIEVVPDDTLVAGDQYLIIDPTVPTHIHIRAGGNIDNSSAELYLGGEKNYVRVTDTSGVRLQNESRSDDFYTFTDPTDFNTATWFESGGNYFVQYTAVDPQLGTLAFSFGDDPDNRLEVFYGSGISSPLTYGGSASNLGDGVYRVAVVQAPPESPTSLTVLEYQIWTTNTNSVQLQNNDFTVSVTDDIRITGNDTFSLRNRSNTDPITIRTDFNGSDYAWEFSPDGRLILPESNEANVAKLTSSPNDANVSLQLYSGNAVRIVSNTVGEPFVWTFSTTGTFTSPGNVSGDNIITNGSVNLGGNLNFTSAEETDTARIFTTAAGTTTSLVLEVGDDNADNIVLRHYSFGANNTIDMLTAERSSNTEANVSVTGNVIATSNVTANNFIGNGDTLSNVAIQETGSWTLAPGVNTVSLSVPLNGTYSIWVNGNIPNGIATYTATAVVTNPNVPVLGEQYAWYYDTPGNALVITSIPDQFVGTQGVISNATPYNGNTANVFTFGITNNSGNTAIVNYGYTKL